MNPSNDPFLWVLLAVVVIGIVLWILAGRTNRALRARIHEEKRGRLAAEAERSDWRKRAVGAEAEAAEAREGREAELAEVRREAEDGTKAVLKAAVLTMQGIAGEQALSIKQAQTAYGDDERVLTDLMKIDHGNAQFTRRAQGIAVLCGGWVGRRERPASVLDVARSAQGRIRDYDRVVVSSRVNAWVRPEVVEPLATVLAELLANATRYSAPDTSVDVSIQSVGTGVRMRVDDAGLGMNGEAIERATALLNAESMPQLAHLGDPPKFGFAVCGLLAGRYGFRVSVDDQSSSGGVRATVLLPDALMTSEPAQPQPQPQPREIEDAVEPAPVRSITREAPVTEASVSAADFGTTVHGLPRRGRRVSAVRALDQDESAQPSQAAAAIGAFGRGSRRGREETSTETEGRNHP